MRIPDTEVGMSYRFVPKTFVILCCVVLVEIVLNTAQGQTRKTPRRPSKEVPLAAGRKEFKTSATQGARPAGDTRPFHYPVQTQAEYTAETDRLIQMYVDAYNVREKQKDPKAKPIQFKEAKKTLVRRANLAWSAAAKNAADDPFGEFARAAKDTQGQIPYNKSYANPLDVIYQGRTQCDGSTDYQLLLYRLKPKKDVPNNANPHLPTLVEKEKTIRPVAILEAGHVLIGAIESGPGGDRLVGYESTAYGKARKDYGPLSGLSANKNPPIPVPMEFYLRAKLEPTKAQRLYVESGIDLLKNYSLDVEALRSRYGHSDQVRDDNQSKIDQISTPWDLPGGPDVPDGDLARMELEAVADDQVGNQITSITPGRRRTTTDGEDDVGRHGPEFSEVEKHWSNLRMTQFVDDDGEFSYPPDWVNRQMFEPPELRAVNSLGQTPVHYLASLQGSEWDGEPRVRNTISMSVLMDKSDVFTPDADGNLPLHIALQNAWDGVQSRLRIQETKRGCIGRMSENPAFLQRLSEGKNIKNDEGLTAFEALAKKLPEACSQAEGLWLRHIIGSFLDHESKDATVEISPSGYSRIKKCLNAGGRNQEFSQEKYLRRFSVSKLDEPPNEPSVTPRPTFKPRPFSSKVASYKDLKAAGGHAGTWRIASEADELDADGNTVLERLILNKNLDSKELEALMRENEEILMPLAHTPEDRSRGPISMLCERGATEDEPKEFATLAANMIGLFQLRSEELANWHHGAIRACGKLAAAAKNPNLMLTLLRDAGSDNNVRKSIVLQLVQDRGSQDASYVEILKAAGVTGKDVDIGGSISRKLRSAPREHRRDLLEGGRYGTDYCPADPVSEYMISTHPDSVGGKALDLWLKSVASCRPEQYDAAVRAFHRFKTAHKDLSFDPSLSEVLKSGNIASSLKVNLWEERACERFQTAVSKMSTEAAQKIHCTDLELTLPYVLNNEDCREYAEKLIAFNSEKPAGDARPKYSRAGVMDSADRLIRQCDFHDEEVLSKIYAIYSGEDFRDPNCENCHILNKNTLSHQTVKHPKRPNLSRFCPTPAAMKVLTPQLASSNCADIEEHLQFAFDECSPKYLEFFKAPIYRLMLKRCHSEISWIYMRSRSCVDEVDHALINELEVLSLGGK